jgi:hypothetical protein
MSSLLLAARIELAKAILGRLPDLPVILVTTYGNIDALKEFGESRILRKPYDDRD